MTDFPWSYVWIIVNLALIFYLGKRFLSQPVGSFLAKRRDEIDRRFSQAEEEVQRAQELSRRGAEKLDQVEMEKERFLAEARERMKRQAEDIRSEAQRDALRIRERTRDGIEREKDAALRLVWQETSDLTLRATGALLPRVITPEDHRRLVKDLLEGIKEVEV